MSTDLSLIAERRAGLAALLGTLLLEEPGPGLADLVGAVPALQPLAADDVAIRCEYERIFLRGVPLYASVFVDDNGQHGGPTLAAVIERYDGVEFTEHRDRPWRVAGADHLGLLLRCHAQLCHRESEAWRHDRPEVAAGIIETERALLRDHVSSWAPVALDAAGELAEDGPYRPLIESVSAFLGEEHHKLRPAPAIGTPIDHWTPPDNLGPARLARLLLAPTTCGTWLSPTVLSGAANSIGAPWRRSDTRSSLRHLIETAHDSGDVPSVLQPILEAVGAAGARYARRADTDSGNAAHWYAWEARVEATVTMLERIMLSGGLKNAQPASEAIIVTAADAAHLADIVDKVVEQLRAAGCTVERESVDRSCSV